MLLTKWKRTSAGTQKPHVTKLTSLLYRSSVHIFYTKNSINEVFWFFASLEWVRVTAFANQWSELQLKPVKPLYHMKVEHGDLRCIISVSYTVRWQEIPKPVAVALNTKLCAKSNDLIQALCRTTVIIMSNNLLLNPVTQQYQRAICYL